METQLFLHLLPAFCTLSVLWETDAEKRRIEALAGERGVENNHRHGEA